MLVRRLALYVTSDRSLGALKMFVIVSQRVSVFWKYETYSTDSVEFKTSSRTILPIERIAAELLVKCSRL